LGVKSTTKNTPEPQQREIKPEETIRRKKIAELKLELVKTVRGQQESGSSVSKSICKKVSWKGNLGPGEYTGAKKKRPKTGVERKENKKIRGEGA